MPIFLEFNVCILTFRVQLTIFPSRQLIVLLLTRSFWQGDPIFLCILQGSERCTLDRSLEEDHVLISSAVAAAVAADAKVQKHVYKVLSDFFFNCPLQPTLIRRCSKYLSSDLFLFSSFVLVDFFQVFHISSLMGNQIRIVLLKTLLGGWITARRIQASARH